MDTATVLENEKLQGVKEARPLEAVMSEEIRELYMATMETNPDFTGELDMHWFKHHFATVAHRHKIIHHKGVLYPTSEQGEERARYNLYFGLVRSRFSTWLKEYIAKKKAGARKPVYPSYHKLAEHFQLPLFPGLNGHDHNHLILNHDLFHRSEESSDHYPVHDPRQLHLFDAVPAHVRIIQARLHAKLDPKNKQPQVKTKN